MTTSQTENLATAFKLYNDKKTAYEEALASYNGALALNLSPGVKNQIIADTRNKKDAAKQAMDNSFTAYSTLRDDLSAQDAAAFAAANPDAYVNIQKNKAESESKASQATAQAEAQSKVEIAKAQAEAAAKLYSQKNTQYLIIGGIVIAVLIIGVYVYKKFF